MIRRLVAAFAAINLCMAGAAARAATAAPATGPSTAPWTMPAPAVLIRAARVFDGRELSRDAMDVLIRDGKIVAVGGSIEAPRDAQVVDAAGQTLLPGLIDCHTHIQGRQSLRQAAAFGVTTQLDLFMPIALARELRAGDDFTRGDRGDFRTAGTLATAPKGHGTQYGVPIPTLAKPGDAATFVGDRIDEGSDYIKIIYDDGSAAGMSIPKLSRETMAAVIAAAHARGKLAVVHVMDLAAARDVIEAGADGLAHVFCNEPPDDAFCDLAKAKGIFVTPTLAVMENFAADGDRDGRAAFVTDARLAPMMSSEDSAALTRLFPRRRGAGVKASLGTARESVRRLHAAGVPILAGSDVPNPGTLQGASLHRELELLVQCGLTPAEALRAATAAPADAYRLADRGRIAPGLRADLILVDGDPTRDITATRAIRMIWIAGRLFERDAYRAVVEQRNAALAKLAGPGRLLVSDFEGAEIESTFGIGWSISTDSLMRGRSIAEMNLVDGSDADGHHAKGGRALRIKGDIRPPLPFAWAGAMFSPGSSIMGPVDLSGKKAITFRAKGDGKATRLMLFSRSMGVSPAFQVFTPGAQWKRFRFALNQFNDSDGKDITALLFSGGVDFGQFEFLIDDLAFE